MFSSYTVWAMKLDRLFDSGEPVISFEFYPPKTERGFASLYRTIADLKQLQPEPEPHSSPSLSSCLASSCLL